MLFVLSLLAAFACAICYGISSVLQKVSADKQKRATSLDPNLLVRLLHKMPYVLGTIVQLGAWPLSIYAVKHLPLFVVQPIISLSVIFTVIFERLAFRRRLKRRTLGAMLLVLVGLAILSLQAGIESARPLTHGTLLVLAIGGPLLILAIGSICVRSTRPWSKLGLAFCAGAAFGMDSVMGRVFPIMHPWWHTLYQPALLAMIAYGLIAVLLFTLALQRSAASIVNATVVGIETILPTVLGIWLLGDTPRSGSFGLLVIGSALALIGTVVVALAPSAGVRPARSVKLTRTGRRRA